MLLMLFLIIYVFSNTSIVHGKVPDSFICTVIGPVVKDKLGNTSR